MMQSSRKTHLVSEPLPKTPYTSLRYYELVRCSNPAYFDGMQNYNYDSEVDVGQALWSWVSTNSYEEPSLLMKFLKRINLRLNNWLLGPDVCISRPYSHQAPNMTIPPRKKPRAVKNIQ